MRVYLKIKQYVAIVMLLLLTLFCGCSSYCVPEEGIWRCDELGVTISREPNIPSAVILDGQERNCMFELGGRGSNYFGLWCMDKGEYWTDILFEGKCIELDEEYLIVLDNKTNKEYRFIRIDK